jgi:hypothetical protein
MRNSLKCFKRELETAWGSASPPLHGFMLRRPIKSLLNFEAAEAAEKLRLRKTKTANADTADLDVVG